MADGTRNFRLAYDPADLNPALRIEANEKVNALQFDTLNRRLDRIEEAVQRLEKRMWLAVYGVAAAVLAQAVQQFSGI